MKSLNIEVILNSHSHINKTSIISIAQHYLCSILVKPNTVLSKFDKELHPVLSSDVKAIIIEDIPGFDKIINFTSFELVWYVYTLNIHGPMQQIESDENDDPMNFATHLVVPATELFNLWENLYYDNGIKENLLRYAQTMMEFSDKGVDMNVIHCNRVILLHGPPGTGKTSLCKALAHKLAVRMEARYNSGLLIEINSHSLFSKWFSESGKLVTKMFGKINEIVENRNLLVCVLIDEIESLAHARNLCTSGNEPSDSIRVVNAVLTQIDQIKRHPNVLILTTSNMTESIDLAFVDRADIKQYLGLPTPKAIYKLYCSCIEELVKAQFIKYSDTESPIYSVLKIEDCDNKYSKQLMEICHKSVGLSGRSLRKVSFLAFSLYLDSSLVELDTFLDALSKAVDFEKKERKHFETIK